MELKKESPSPVFLFFKGLKLIVAGGETQDRRET